jgi:hypothetical protein
MEGEKKKQSSIEAAKQEEGYTYKGRWPSMVVIGTPLDLSLFVLRIPIRTFIVLIFS